MAKQDHPRLRGENFVLVSAVGQIGGSPPLARGKLIRANASTQHIRITPACAGKTPQLIRSERFNRDHPRLRGENQG